VPERLLKKVLRQLVRLVSTVVKILGTNPYCTSLIEAGFVFIVSNVALIFLVFTTLVDREGATLSIDFAVHVIRDAVSSSEIFVYIMALLAPALYVMFFEWRAKRSPIFYFALLLLQGTLIIGSAYIYGRAKSGGIANQAFADSWAWIAFWCGMFVWYVSLVYTKMYTLRSPEPPMSGQKILEELEQYPNGS
jgi:hypothetical protein